MPPPKREYNAVSAIADEIWQYRTGGNLTIFDKVHDTAEEGRSRTAEVLAAKHTASLQLLCTVGGNQARLDARSEFEISPDDRRRRQTTVARAARPRQSHTTAARARRQPFKRPASEHYKRFNRWIKSRWHR